jgi:hypothetical protein
MAPKNRHIYFREAGNRLIFKGTALGRSAEECLLVLAKSRPGASCGIGKYVVTDIDFTEIEQVYLTYDAKAQS